MKIGKDGLSLIKEMEGLKLQAYLCPAGKWTIGYGCTQYGNKCTQFGNGPVKKGDVITSSIAEDLLRYDLEWVEEAINDLVKVPLLQNQFDALCSFVYNLGKTAFSKSTLLKLINKRAYDAAANEFPKWVYAGGKVLPGLVKRRLLEQKLWEG